MSLMSLKVRTLRLAASMLGLAVWLRGCWACWVLGGCRGSTCAALRCGGGGREAVRAAGGAVQPAVCFGRAW